MSVYQLQHVSGKSSIDRPNHGGKLEDMAQATCELNKILGDYRTALDELDQLRDAVRALWKVKGRYHTQKACERLIALLPENANRPHAGEPVTKP